MKIRSSLHINNRDKTLNLFATLQETPDHLVLKLATSLFFFDWNPTIETGATHAALCDQEYYPDLMANDEGGAVTLWIECGKTTIHKLEKVSKRFRNARVIVLTPQPLQGQQQAEAIKEEGLRVEVWTFDYGEFERWRQCVQDRNDVIGEANETSLNLVINEQVFFTELKRC